MFHSGEVKVFQEVLSRDNIFDKIWFHTSLKNNGERKVYCGWGVFTYLNVVESGEYYLIDSTQPSVYFGLQKGILTFAELVSAKGFVGRYKVKFDDRVRL